MKLFSRFLIGVAVTAGGVGLPGLLSTAAVAQEAVSRSAPSNTTSNQVAQAPLPTPQSNTIIARMSLRITELENEIRRLTGRNEELTHRLGQLEETIKKSLSDTALRLSALEQGGGAANTPATGSAPTVADTASPTSVMPAGPGRTAAAPVSGADKGAKVLGTLSGGQGRGQTARAVEPEAAASAETPQQQYDRAHSLIVKQRKYGEAERVLRNFIDVNPEHALASNAHYWLGRTYFVRADYENAAFAFAEGFQKFPEAEKAPANLLNLGMSLARLGKNREACTTYTRLLRTYKSTDASIKRRITRERRRAKCRSR